MMNDLKQLGSESLHVRIFGKIPNTSIRLEGILQISQLMVNCWFGVVVWDCRGTPKEILESQTTRPQTNN